MSPGAVMPADALVPAVLAPAPDAVMLADARAPAVLAVACPDAVMLQQVQRVQGAAQDARAPAVLAPAPLAIMLADARLAPPRCSHRGYASRHSRHLPRCFPCPHRSLPSLPPRPSPPLAAPVPAPPRAPRDPVRSTRSHTPAPRGAMINCRTEGTVEKPLPVLIISDGTNVHTGVTGLRPVG